jgi:hypothetical protein
MPSRSSPSTEKAIQSGLLRTGMGENGDSQKLECPLKQFASGGFRCLRMSKIEKEAGYANE